jgi:hypothetical protein
MFLGRQPPVEEFVWRCWLRKGVSLVKKALVIIGGFFLVAIISIAALFGYLAVVGPGLDKESKAYVMETVPVICSSFDPATFSKYASPELLKVAPPEELAKIFAWFRQLGQFKGVVDAPGEANISVTTGNGKVITAKYKAKVEFDTGQAIIEIVLIKRDDGWKYKDFHIYSMALVPQSKPVPSPS